MSKIKNSYTSEPVCPYCGHEVRDAWEFSLSDGESTEYECGSCDQTFDITRHITVDYSTHKKECEKHKLKIDYECDDGNQKFTKYECQECNYEFYDWELPNGKYPKLKPDQFEIVESAKGT